MSTITDFKTVSICKLVYNCIIQQFDVIVKDLRAILLFYGVRLLHFLQQLGGQLPAGGIGSGLEIADGTGLAGDVEPGAGLPFGRHVLIAGKRGADVGAETGVFVVGHGQSSQGCGVLVVPVSTLAGIPSMMVISGSGLLV